MKPTIEQIYERHSVVRATWSDAARAAAAESRKAHATSESLMPKDGPRFHPVDAIPPAVSAAAHASYAADHAEKGNHATAEVRHRDAAKAHTAAFKATGISGHSEAAKLHTKLSEMHKNLKNL